MPVHQSHVGGAECDDRVGVEHVFCINGNDDEQSGQGDPEYDQMNDFGCRRIKQWASCTASCPNKLITTTLLGNIVEDIMYNYGNIPELLTGRASYWYFPDSKLWSPNVNDMLSDCR